MAWFLKPDDVAIWDDAPVDQLLEVRRIVLQQACYADVCPF